MIGLAKTAPGPGNLDLIERPEPTVGAGDVLLEVHGAGVCGTDLHIEAGEYDSVTPVTLGHEVSGVVIEVGAGVGSDMLGKRVVSETFSFACGVCRPCRDGRRNLCPSRRSLGTHVDGAFASRVVVPASNLHQLPDWIDEHAASLAEPLACVCNALFDPAAVEAGDRVLVVGPGPIGLLAGQVARALGASVVVTGLPHDAARLELARQLGLQAETFGEGAGGVDDVDVAIECSGTASGAATALAAARRGGRYVQLGIFGAPVELELDLMVYGELEVVTAFASTSRSWRRAMALIEARSVALEPLVSSVSTLQEWPEAFADLRAGRKTKVVFDPRLTPG